VGVERTIQKKSWAFLSTGLLRLDRTAKVVKLTRETFITDQVSYAVNLMQGLTYV
jgi:hypothetical protein